MRHYFRKNTYRCKLRVFGGGRDDLLVVRGRAAARPYHFQKRLSAESGHANLRAFVVGSVSFNSAAKRQQIHVPGTVKNFLIASMGGADRLPCSISRTKIVNAELCKKAAEKVGNPNVLVNLISRRVRQLNSGNGGLSRPLVANTTNLGVADIALREILEEKIGWEMPEMVELVRPAAKKRRKR
jgi:DNA-directed RNA polymerase subunit omega